MQNTARLDLLEHHPLLVDTVPDILNASSSQPSPNRVDRVLSWGKELGDLVGSVVLSVPGRSRVGTRSLQSVSWQRRHLTLLDLHLHGKVMSNVHVPLGETDSHREGAAFRDERATNPLRFTLNVQVTTLMEDMRNRRCRSRGGNGQAKECGC